MVGTREVLSFFHRVRYNKSNMNPLEKNPERSSLDEPSPHSLLRAESDFFLDQVETFEGEYQLLIRLEGGQEAHFEAHCLKEGSSFQCRVSKDDHVLNFRQFGDENFNPESGVSKVVLRSIEPGQEDWLASFEYKDPKKQLH